MKKISLRKVSDILSENEMKKVVGGYDGSNCLYVSCYYNGNFDGDPWTIKVNALYASCLDVWDVCTGIGWEPGVCYGMQC